MQRPELLEVGYVARAHGIQGELGVRTYDPASEVLFDVTHLVLVPRGAPERTFTVEDARGANDTILISLEGIATRSQAEALVGAKAFVLREEVEPPGEGEFFQGDLVGLSAYDEAGSLLGRVEEVWNTGPVPNLVIRAEGKEWIVPFADEFVPTVDLPGGRIVVRPPQLIE